MSIPVPCYLVEWYRPELTEEPVDHTAAKLNECAASMSAEGSPVQLVTMLAVPCDEVCSEYSPAVRQPSSPRLAIGPVSPPCESSPLSNSLR